MGTGTTQDPFLVEWLPQDMRNPMSMARSLKWVITVLMALGTLSIAFSSTAFSGAVIQIRKDFRCSDELAILSVSLYVLGFAIAPMTWAPLSEMYGRQIIYIITFSLTSISAGASIGSKSITTLLVLRFLAGWFGSSAIVNAAGVIADMFVAKERGIAMIVYTSAPFLGPTLGPVAGNFVGQYGGWRWVDGMTVIFTATLLVLGVMLVPETYSPYILRKRAARMSRMTGRVYRSKLEAGKPNRTSSQVLKTAIMRPWVMLFREPIILFMSLYVAIIYGTSYLIFTAFPIVYAEERGWSQGISGLPYLGVMVGQIVAMPFYLVMEVAYQKKIVTHPGKASPEGRLDPALIGSVALPVGLFWFAWTTYSSIHWIIGIIGCSLFGFGQVLMFISMMNYTVDAYTVFAASALAASAILRGLFGAVFPLFTTYMYANLGVQWASSVPAFLALACLPLPFIFKRLGKPIRDRSKYANQAQEITKQMLSHGQSVEMVKKTSNSHNSDAKALTDSISPVQEV
ncbi:hypothetical protein MBLNU457_6218t1 [Dothideomycetes sp. NU457]